MIRSSESNFPCMEASRCYLTWKERGVRLGCTPKGKLYCTAKRQAWEEWYVNMSTFATSSNDDSPPGTLEFYDSSNPQGSSPRPRKQVLQFQSVPHGFFLQVSSIDGKLSTTKTSDTSCLWIMERSSVSSSSSTETMVSSQDNATDARDDNDMFESTTMLFSLTHYESSLSLRYNEAQPVTFTTSKISVPPSPLADGSGKATWQDDSSTVVEWEMEFTSGELCFISNPAVNLRIRCNVTGTLSLNKAWKGWEIFRFIEVGNCGQVVISSWTHSSKYLASNGDGQVYTTENRLGHDERWLIQKWSTGDGLWIQSVPHGRVLSLRPLVQASPRGGPKKLLASLSHEIAGKNSEDRYELYTTTKRKEPNAKWHMEAAHSHVYYISHANHNFLIATSKAGPMTTRNRQEWEQWKLERANNGYFTLWNAAHQLYLGSTSNGHLHTTSLVGPWSMWDIQSFSQGFVILVSSEHQQALCCDEHGILFTSDILRESDISFWRLEPRMPLSLSGPQMASLGAAGAVGLALTAAMPFAVLGMAEFAGIAVTGVAATDLAVAGSEVAAAAGFTSSAMIGFGSGALLGAGVIGKTAMSVIDTKKDELTTDLKDEETSGSLYRPISNWRNW